MKVEILSLLKSRKFYFSYRYGYQGQFAEKDGETDWVNFQLRMYDPAIGRWMSTDPYGQYHSPYVGMGNNPISRIDPGGGKDGCDNCPKNYDGSYVGSKMLDEIVVTGTNL